VKTALDSSVLLDVLGADPVFGQRSRAALRAAYASGALVACDVVWAEVRAHFADDATFDEALRILGVQYDPIDQDAARTAGHLWKASRQGNGRRPDRKRVVADFLIAAHAQLQAEVLLSRDRGFYRRYFRGLRVIDPGARS
jgi:predicted nucleic acid-binding protein